MDKMGTAMSGRLECPQGPSAGGPRQDVIQNGMMVDNLCILIGDYLFQKKTIFLIRKHIFGKKYVSIRKYAFT